MVLVGNQKVVIPPRLGFTKACLLSSSLCLGGNGVHLPWPSRICSDVSFPSSFGGGGQGHFFFFGPEKVENEGKG